MGYIRHHMIIVTSNNHHDLEEAHSKAKQIFQNVSEIVYSVANHYASFFIPPDGSKEGWQTSNDYDIRRLDFIGWLRKKGEYGSLDWAELQFGDDYGETKVISHSDQ